MPCQWCTTVVNLQTLKLTRMLLHRKLDIRRSDEKWKQSYEYKHLFITYFQTAMNAVVLTEQITDKWSCVWTVRERGSYDFLIGISSHLTCVLITVNNEMTLHCSHYMTLTLSSFLSGINYLISMWVKWKIVILAFINYRTATNTGYTN